VCVRVEGEALENKHFGAEEVKEVRAESGEFLALQAFLVFTQD